MNVILKRAGLILGTLLVSMSLPFIFWLLYLVETWLILLLIIATLVGNALIYRFLYHYWTKGIYVIFFILASSYLYMMYLSNRAEIEDATIIAIYGLAFVIIPLFINVIAILVILMIHAFRLLTTFLKK